LTASQRYVQYIDINLYTTRFRHSLYSGTNASKSVPVKVRVSGQSTHRLHSVNIRLQFHSETCHCQGWSQCRERCYLLSLE